MIEEIQILIRYAVPQDELDAALELVEKYKEDNLILRTFHEYYSTLPEGREEAVTRIATLAVKQGVFLFVVVSTNNEYLYVVSAETVVLLGAYGDEIAPEVVTFFEFSSQDEFLKECIPAHELEVYKEKGKIEEICPVCGVLEGEEHLLGCVVEVCPWCEGQLNSCNCRFEQLEVDEIVDEEQLEVFEDMLSAKGRIPFAKDHKPAYPGTSEGLDGEPNN